MTYTIKMDLFIDDDKILSDEEVVEAVKELINSTTIEFNNIQVVDVND